MFALSSFIDFIFSVIVFFFVVSSLASIVTELIAEQLNWRGKLLYSEVKKVFETQNSLLPNLGERVYNHPLVLALKKRENRLPEEIPVEIFSQVLVNEVNDVAGIYESMRGPDVEAKKQTAGTYTSGSFAMEVLPDSGMKKIISTLGASGPVQSMSAGRAESPNYTNGIESWYACFISVLNHKYKGRIRWSLFFSGVALSLIMSLGTVHWIEKLYNDEVTRAAFVQLGDEIGADTEGQFDPSQNRDALFQQYIQVLSKDSAKIAQLTILFNTLSESEKDSTKRRSTLELMQDTALHSLYKDLLIQTRASLVDSTSNSFYNLKIPKIHSPSGDTEKKWYSLILQILDHLLTGFIAAAGAPFWYDLIRKIYTIRKNKS